MIIYKITNNINKKIYVGQTSYSLEKRIKQHLKAAKQKQKYLLYRAINKYKIENFSWEVIDKCKTKQELFEREKYYIKLLKSKRPNGYNLTDGGEGNLGWKPSKATRLKISERAKGRVASLETRKKISLAGRNRKHSEETKRKIGLGSKGKKISDKHRKQLIKINTGKKHSEETKRKMSEAKKGKKHYFYGKHHTEESKRKMSNSHKEKKSNHKKDCICPFCKGNGEYNGNWKGGVTKRKYYCIICNKKIHQNTFLYGSKMCLKCYRKNTIPWNKKL